LARFKTIKGVCLKMADVKPLYLLAGGGPQRAEREARHIARALSESGDRPRVAYIGAASGDSILFYKFMKAILHKAGAAEVDLVRLAGARADIPAAKRLLSAADVIFLSGGEVDEGMDWLARHGLVGFLWELRSQGKVFLGVSAGAIMMGSNGCAGRQRDDSTARLSTASVSFRLPSTPMRGRGLERAQGGPEAPGPRRRGYGIRSGGLVVVDGRGRMEAAGEGLLCYVNNGGEIERAE
jgi:cyanophycinase-like exopeptidase